MNYIYGYLIGCFVLLIVWLLFFLWRKENRKIMLWVSLIVGVCGLIADPVYYLDWWHPLTITGTVPGIESFLFGFAVGGIASVAYEDLYSSKIKIKKVGKKGVIRENVNLIALLLFAIAIFIFCYFTLRMGSFKASFPAMLIPIFIIWIKRRDLIFDSIAEGFLLSVISFVFYIVPEFLFPGWIQSSWSFENISGITLLKVPIEDVVWYFISGMLVGPLYEYWKEAKVKDSKLEKEIIREERKIKKRFAK